MASYPDWEYQFLQQLGAPASVENLNALNYWAQSEGTTGSNNPLAISGVHPGATTCIAQCGSSSPIMAYDSIASGVAANVAFLQNNNYGAVVSAFVHDQGMAAIWSAINNSGWCRGCQDGHYPSVLYGALGGKAPALSSSSGTGTAAVGGGSGAAGGCAAKGKFFTLPHTDFGPTHCQVKALLGATEILAGGLVMLVGVVLLVSATGKVSALAKITPVGRAASALGAGRARRSTSTARSSSAPTTSAPAPPKPDVAYRAGVRAGGTGKISTSQAESDVSRSFGAGREQGRREGAEGERRAQRSFDAAYRQAERSQGRPRGIQPEEVGVRRRERV